MIGYICLLWLGMQFDAPFWYYLLVVIGLAWRLLQAIASLANSK